MRLVITADDYGVNAARTSGIAEHTAFISRTSLLVNGEDSRRAARLAEVHGLSTGLHFNITEGRPTSSTESPLVQGGRFRGKVGALRLLTGQQSTEAVRLTLKEAVKQELLAQLSEFYTLTGRRQVWLDGHHHIHVLPIVVDAVAEVFSASDTSFRLTGLRVPWDPTLPTAPGIITCEEITFDTNEECFGLPFWQRISELGRRIDRRRFPQTTIPSAFIGFDLTGVRCTRMAVRAKLQLLTRCVRDDALVEYMTHIGYTHPPSLAQDAFFHDQFACSKDRETELAVVVSEAFRADRRHLGFELVHNADCVGSPSCML